MMIISSPVRFLLFVFALAFSVRSFGVQDVAATLLVVHFGILAYKASRGR